MRFTEGDIYENEQKQTSQHYICGSFICFFAGTINHIINESGGIISSLLLALGCLCFSAAFCKKK